MTEKKKPVPKSSGGNGKPKAAIKKPALSDSYIDSCREALIKSKEKFDAIKKARSK